MLPSGRETFAVQRFRPGAVAAATFDVSRSVATVALVWRSDPVSSAGGLLAARYGAVRLSLASLVVRHLDRASALARCGCHARGPDHGLGMGPRPASPQVLARVPSAWPA
jgi:hypothetical protein